MAALACAWIAWCTAIGPLMRSDVGLAGFGFGNVVRFVAAFAVSFGLIWLLVALARSARSPQRRPRKAFTKISGQADSTLRNWASRVRLTTFGRGAARFGRAAARIIRRATDRWWKLWLIFIVAWLWVPMTLLSAYGADINSQAREFSWAWNQWTGIAQPYIGFFSFVPMDIYPTAHYMWPDNPTYLTDQHNIVLTVLYGATAAASRYFTGSNDAGFVVLSAGQWLFATFCCAATANRFFNLPWLRRKTKIRRRAATVSTRANGSRPATVSSGRSARRRFGFGSRRSGSATDSAANLSGSSSHLPLEAEMAAAGATNIDFLHPERGVAPRAARLAASAPARLVILLALICCPLAFFSTISLTKSPLFAFAFLWWFGCLYELYMTQSPRSGSSTRRERRNRSQTIPAESGSGSPTRRWRRNRSQHTPAISHSGSSSGAAKVRGVTIAALVMSDVVMLVSAKYAWYIILAQVVLSLIADRRRWKVYVFALLLPTLLIHGGTTYLIDSGRIIGGDPIESRGVQLQMIARVAKVDPDSIPQSAKDKLEPIFNLDQMAQAYSRQDADPVKSSGIQSKKVSYKWRTVTADDMKQFNAAWLEITLASPRVALDALFAECYGYFDIFDPPYVSMTYYVNNDYVQQSSTWIKTVNHKWRDLVAGSVYEWSKVPVLGWFVHGNFYVTLTLIIGAAELALRRWRALSWHMPLLLLMGVMITAPANNFERHMLPIVFCFGFLCLQFWRDSHIPHLAGAGSHPVQRFRRRTERKAETEPQRETFQQTASRQQEAFQQPNIPFTRRLRGKKSWVKTSGRATVGRQKEAAQ